ncbi:MAG: cation-transporting P-type ATPase [Candidatus Thorarchaeota archaeon]|nr:MAG: cation-transporting P-type ATPase [Candidatus Thorarchaeota archaeon]
MSESDAITESESAESQYQAMSIEEVLQVFSASAENGLSSSDVSSRTSKYGPNTIPKIKGTFWQVYLAPIMNWLITIYLVSSFALVGLAYMFPTANNELAQATIWLGVVLINALVAIFQQYRAQKKLEALEKLSAGEARVIRNGSEAAIPPDEIVPGDIVKLEQGDRIPADGRIITCTNLTTNEASLTGESIPVNKESDPVLKRDIPLTDMFNIVFFGTYVATGTATFVTTETGGRTEIGKIQGELEQLNTGDIPLRKKVNLLAKYLATAAVFLMILSVLWPVFGVPFLFGNPIDLGINIIAETLSIGITKAMTIMPINIPLLTTIVLLTGVLAMARKGVIIRDLSAVESLGRVSVIASDKTGTMTKNQMMVKFIWDTENLYHVTGEGYEPIGEILRLPDDSSLDLFKPSEAVKVTDVLGWKGLHRIIANGGINNDSEIERREIPDQGVNWIPIGDPTDAALLTLFRKSGVNEEELREKYKIEKEFPFESELKRMSKVCKDGKKLVVFTKGATEVLLPRCALMNGGRRPSAMDENDAKRIQAQVNGFAARGYRVISFAYQRLDEIPSGANIRDKVEKDLIYLGFVCIVDPPREGVKEAVSACHSAGINVVMITGDSSATAKTIAENLGIHEPGSLVVEGGQIETLTEHEFAKVNVFARVNPAHKQVIVERYQNQKKVVAMTGDGVNDALALAMSDAGIAMGITGTDVAKEAADLVITDDSFASIVTGVHQGRGLFTKIRMMIYFYVAINLFESIIFFGAMFILPEVINLLTTWQALYLVVTTHSFPGLALVFDKTSPGAMKEKPRDSEEIITKQMARFMAINVILMALGAGMAYLLTYTGWFGIVGIYPENLEGFYPVVEPFEAGRTVYEAKAAVMLLTVILLVESTLVLIIRRINMPITSSLREPGTGRFVPFLGLIYLAHFLLMYHPLVPEILSTYGLHFYFIPLTLFDWIVCIVLSLPAIVGMEIYKKRLRSERITL